MSANWAYNLDMLAQNGVIDFDGAAFITGQAPRYVGRPAMPPSPYADQVPPAPALNQPQIDEFKLKKQKLPKQQNSNNNDIVQNPSWKKWLFAAMTIGGLVFLGFKAKSIYTWVKDFLNSPGSKLKNLFSWSKTKTYFQNKWQSIKHSCSNGWSKFTGFFKSKTPKP